MDIPLALPSGHQLLGRTPVVVIGPNGSGKTRQTRNISSSPPPEFVNALRNTRVAAELPAMGIDSAKANYEQQKAQSRGAFWELSSEFDFMLSQLLAQYSMAAIEFSEQVQLTPEIARNGPLETPLRRIKLLWSEIFPGRSLDWKDWKPVVTSTVSGGSIQYSGNQMSDGEKSALFLAGRVFSSAPGVLVVDEPETHFHSLLAVRFWNALEDARPDIRFVYVTHDLTFALSRRGADYVLASPTEGLKIVDFAKELPEDVAGALLGSASLSFYASRVIFCEGDEGSYDSLLLNAWFSGADTVVKPVGGCQNVLRCVQALRESGIASSLEAVGVVDSDFHASSFLESMPTGVMPLAFHEIESILSMPEIVAAVAQYMGQNFDSSDYALKLRASVDSAQQHSITIQRWKAAIEPKLTGLVASTSKKNVSIDELTSEIPNIFNMESWSFDPSTLLREENQRVSDALNDPQSKSFLRIIPGKQLLPLAARQCGMEKQAYVDLVMKALRSTGGDFENLRTGLVTALSPHLPPRAVAATPGPLPL